MKIASLTLRQPWASLIAQGAKQIETRSWPTSHRGLLAIHAAKRNPPDLRALIAHEPFLSALAGLNPGDYMGKVVAVVELVDCKLITSDNIPPEPERSFGDYQTGRFMWILRSVRRLAEPVTARGKQGLWIWEVPEDIRILKDADFQDETDT
ncbi:MAG: ASCH domain-containing protein [Peptococcaceae bacterium]|nr:ASCH domain-containing protein [Peptococcaceae bacterium]